MSLFSSPTGMKLWEISGRQLLRWRLINNSLPTKYVLLSNLVIIEHGIQGDPSISFQRHVKSSHSSHLINCTLAPCLSTQQGTVTAAPSPHAGCVGSGSAVCTHPATGRLLCFVTDSFVHGKDLVP